MKRTLKLISVIALLLSCLGTLVLLGWYLYIPPLLIIEIIISTLVISISIRLLLLYWQQLESRTWLRLAFDYSPVGMALVSPKGRYLKVNKALCDLVGYSESEMLQMDFQHIAHPEDIETDRKYITQLYNGQISFYRMEKRYIRHDKTTIWVLLTGSIIRNEKGKPLYYIGQMQDINDKKKAEEELSFKAYFDTLTGLVNRNQLEHSLELIISTSHRQQQQFAIFFVDLDHFKHINDSFGHDVGDELLKIVGDRLRKSVRKTDIAARLGGDEFILVLNGIESPEIAAIFAEKILNVLLIPIKIKWHELLITASIGIGFYPSDGENYQSLIKSADLALYKAKEKGRNNYQFCTRKLNDEIKEKLLFKEALQKAVNNKEFYLTYLPKIDSKQNIIGFEALLRWKNTRYGDVSPSKILPLAEEIGIINQIDEWIVKTTIEQGLQWRTTLNLPVNMTLNISTKQYLEPEFTRNILNELQSMQFSPHYIALEINENLIMQDPAHSMVVIRDLKIHGIQIIIDNFGTGYSSLNYLNQFGVDYIKIDRQFISNVVENIQDRELVTAIIALSRKLNIKIIAEGVESMEQFLLLSQLGCDEFQGYYISEPLITEAVLPFVKKHTKQALLIK